MFLRAFEFFDCCRANRIDPLDHRLYQHLRCGGAGGNAHLLLAAQPSRFDLSGVVHHPGIHPHVLRNFAQAVGIGTVG
jgi:hypothetical protein